MFVQKNSIFLIILFVPGAMFVTTLFDVYYIFSLTLSIASTNQLYDSGYSATFSSTSCVKDPHFRRLIGISCR